MCLRPNTDKIYVYGGNLEHLDDFTADGRKKSQRIYCISIISKTIETLTFSDQSLEPKVGVSGSFITFFGPNTLISYGGSEPNMRHGGRSIMMYTAENVQIPICSMQDDCKIQTSNREDKRTRWLHCKRCKSVVHQICDPRYNKSKSKIPQDYYCPKCKI